jgi:hypothetical protein
MMALAVATALAFSSCGAGRSTADPLNDNPPSYFGCTSWIAGTVRDAATGAVVSSRTAVAIESGYPTPSVETILRPGSDGKFSFCADRKEYVIVAIAADANGNYYAPAVRIVSSIPALDSNLMVAPPTVAPAYLAGPVSTDKANVSLRVYPVVSR